MRPAASGRSQPSARRRLARSAVSATSRLGGSRPISAHSGGGPGALEVHHQALARIDLRRGAIGFKRKSVMTGESRQVERRAARPDFPGQAGHDRGPSRHRLQVKGDAIGHGVLRHVGIERRHARRADRRCGRVDGQVRVDFDPCTGAHLPAHARQQVGLERPERRRKEDVAQRGVGGRERGIGMDHHGIGAELAHVLDEMAKRFILRSSAHRGHGIEPEAGDAPGPRPRGIEAQVVRDFAKRGIARRKIAVNGEEVRRIGGLGLEREREAETELLGDLQAGSRVAAIGPHHRPWRAAKVGGELAARADKVGADARAVLPVVLVVPRRRIVGPRDGRRRHAALRVGLHAAMQGIAVRGELDQSRRLHLARLSPGDEVTARHPPVAAVGYRATGLTLHPDADQRRYDRESVDLQQRKDARVEALVAVVEGDENRLVGQRSHAARGGRQVVERHGGPAGAFQPVEELHQQRCRDGIGLELVRAVDHVVEGDRHEALAGRLAPCVADRDGHGEEHEQAQQPAHRPRSSGAGRRRTSACSRPSRRRRGGSAARRSGIR